MIREPRQADNASKQRFFPMAWGFAVFLDYLFYGMWVPLIPAYVPAVRESGQAGWVITTYGAGVLLCPVVFALCRRRMTHARALLAGAILKCAALALLAGVSDTTLFAAGRVLQGLGSGLTWSAAFAFLSLRYPTRGATAITWAGTAGSVGYAIGPVISAWTHERLSPAAPPIVMAACLAIGVIVCGARVGDALPRVAQAAAPAGPRLRELATRKGMPLALWAIAVVAASWNVIESLLPLRHCSRAAMSLQDMGQLFTVANVVALALTPAIVVIVERTSARVATYLGAALMSGALGALAFSTSWSVGVGAVLAAQIAYRFVYYPMSAEVGRIAERMGDTSRLAAFGLSNSVYSLGMLVTGGAQTLLGIHCNATQWMLFASAGVALAGGAMFFFHRDAAREGA